MGKFPINRLEVKEEQEGKKALKDLLSACFKHNGCKHFERNAS